MQSDEHRDGCSPCEGRRRHRPVPADRRTRDGGGAPGRARRVPRRRSGTWCQAHVPAGWRQAQTGASRRGVRQLPAGLVRRAARRPASRSRTGRASGAAGCPPPSRSCSTPSSPPTTRPGWSWPSSRSTTPRRRCSPRAPTSSASGTSRPSWTARSGSRASPSPRPGPIWPACGPPHARRATPTSSTGRSCGPAAPCTPTGACCWPAPTRPRRNGAASRTSCSTCGRPVSTSGRSGRPPASRTSARSS